MDVAAARDLPKNGPRLSRGDDLRRSLSVRGCEDATLGGIVERGVLTRGVEPPRVSPYGPEPYASAIPPRERERLLRCATGGFLQGQRVNSFLLLIMIVLLILPGESAYPDDHEQEQESGKRLGAPLLSGTLLELVRLAGFA